VKKVLVLNGPNLGMLGSREPEVYGSYTLADLKSSLDKEFPEIDIDLRQTDSESEMISWVHEAFKTQLPVILNAGAFTHYSYALADAVAMHTKSGNKLIEVHISNPYARESFRHKSTFSAVATGVIAGFGFGSYRLALAEILKEEK